jgi:hypothetical protein
VYRRSPRNRAHLGLRPGLLHADGGGGADTLLEVGGALRRAPGPLAQPPDLARLGEHQQRQDRYAEQRSERCDRSDLSERARERERERE